MSIYRRLDGLPSRDIDAVQAKREKPAQSQATSPRGASPKEDHERLRKASPASAPLPRTFEWVASLPRDLQPTALLRQYPRIANVIAAAWRGSRALRSYMDCLFTDDRGNRQGFPPDVLAELLALREYYDSVDTANPPIWTDVPKRGNAGDGEPRILN
jgi:hypothetical protein